MSDAKKTHVLATSSGEPPLFIGMASLQPCTVFSSRTSVISVSIKPGATALDLTPLEPNSRATDLVNPIIPALDAA